MQKTRLSAPCSFAYPLSSCCKPYFPSEQTRIPDPHCLGRLSSAPPSTSSSHHCTPQSSRCVFTVVSVPACPSFFPAVEHLILVYAVDKTTGRLSKFHIQTCFSMAFFGDLFTTFRSPWILPGTHQDVIWQFLSKAMLVIPFSVALLQGKLYRLGGSLSSERSCRNWKIRHFHSSRQLLVPAF